MNVYELCFKYISTTQLIFKQGAFNIKCFLRKLIYLNSGNPILITKTIFRLTI